MNPSCSCDTHPPTHHTHNHTLAHTNTHKHSLSFPPSLRLCACVLPYQGLDQPCLRGKRRQNCQRPQQSTARAPLDRRSIPMLPFQAGGVRQEAHARAAWRHPVPSGDRKSARVIAVRHQLHRTQPVADTTNVSHRRAAATVVCSLVDAHWLLRCACVLSRGICDDLQRRSNCRLSSVHIA